MSINMTLNQPYVAGRFYYEDYISRLRASWNYYILVFTLIFGVIFYDLISNTFGFTYIDELIALTLMLYWMFSPRRSVKEFYYFIFIALFYLVYSLVYPHNVAPAIYTDFFIQAKPYVAFYTVYALNFGITRRQERNICRWCKFFSLYTLVIGVWFLAGNEEIIFTTFGHPSRYATACTICGVMYLIYSRQRRQDVLWSVVMVGIGCISLRSKAYGFFAAYVFVMLLIDKINYRRLFTLKNILLAVICVAAVLYFSWEKFSFYFINGSEGVIPYSRPLLYISAWDILQDYPLFGVGLGSYATHASAVWYSPVYYTYELYVSNEIGNGLFISDTFFPVFAEFGFVGIFLFILFWRNRVNTARANYKITQNKILFKIALLTVVFFFIESTSDSTFTHNRGMAMLMLYAIILNNSSTTKYSILPPKWMIRQRLSEAKREENDEPRRDG